MKAGRILILDITINADQYILINLYNANTEQLKVLEELESQNERIILASGFNIFLGSKLEAKCGKPLLKRKSIAKLIEKKESSDI